MYVIYFKSILTMTKASTNRIRMSIISYNCKEVSTAIFCFYTASSAVVQVSKDMIMLTLSLRDIICLWYVR